MNGQAIAGGAVGAAGPDGLPRTAGVRPDLTARVPDERRTAAAAPADPELRVARP